MPPNQGSLNSDLISFVCGFDFPGLRQASTAISDVTPPSLPWPMARCRLTESALFVGPRQGPLGESSWSFVRWWYRRRFKTEFADDGNVFSLPWKSASVVQCWNYGANIKDSQGKTLIQLSCTGRNAAQVAECARAAGLSIERGSWFKSMGGFFQKR